MATLTSNLKPLYSAYLFGTTPSRKLTRFCNAPRAGPESAERQQRQQQLKASFYIHCCWPSSDKTEALWAMSWDDFTGNSGRLSVNLVTLVMMAVARTGPIRDGARYAHVGERAVRSIDC